MIDPRPSVPEEIDLTELNIFSGYKNNYTGGHRHIDKSDQSYGELTEAWMKSLENTLIGFSSFTADEIPDKKLYLSVWKDTGRKLAARTHAKSRMSSLVKALGVTEAPSVNGVCDICGEPHLTPGIVRSLYPLQFEYSGGTLCVDSAMQLCPRCALIDSVNESETYGYSASATSTNSYSTVNRQTLKLNDVSVYAAVAEIIKSSHSAARVDTKRLNSGAVDITAVDIYDESGQKEISDATIDHLDNLVDSMDDIWAANVSGLRHSLGVGRPREVMSAFAALYDYDVELAYGLSAPAQGEVLKAVTHMANDLNIPLYTSTMTVGGNGNYTISYSDSSSSTTYHIYDYSMSGHDSWNINFAAM